MIRVSHVSKSFGRVQALDGVSLSVRPGEAVALVGANGSGKTTLLRAILGLVRTTGSVTIGGINVQEHPELALRHVAYVPQIAPPIEAPVRDVLRAACTLRNMLPSNVSELAERFSFPLESAKGIRFRDLSGGMKQKLLAILALAAHTPILACDEPTANLDAAAREAFFAAIRERSFEQVLLLCSHRADDVRDRVHRIVEFSDGRIARDVRDASLSEHSGTTAGTPERLVAS